MADPLDRGPVGDDESILREVADLAGLVRERSGDLRRGTLALALALGDLLEDVANRLLDMQDAINDRHLPGPVDTREEDERAEPPGRRLRG